MMASPVRLVLVGALAFCFKYAIAGDEDGHSISPYLAAAIADGLPKYDPAQKAANKPPTYAPAQQQAPEQSAAGIVRLPEYVVRESRPLDREQMEVIEGRANVAMRRYLGDTNSLDRGILNHYTFPELWSKIPVLRFLPCPLPGVTNQVRATELYEQDERLSLMNDLMSLESLSDHPSDGNSKAVKRDIRDSLKANP